MAFHARYKLLLMAYNQKETRALGRLLGEARGKAFQEVLFAYEEGFLRATEKPYRLGGPWADALLHAFGPFQEGT
jgi:uncharacterized protein YbgA (DUF1722 family)